MTNCLCLVLWAEAASPSYPSKLALSTENTPLRELLPSQHRAHERGLQITSSREQQQGRDIQQLTRLGHSRLPRHSSQNLTCVPGALRSRADALQLGGPNGDGRWTGLGIPRAEKASQACQKCRVPCSAEGEGAPSSYARSVHKDNEQLGSEWSDRRGRKSTLLRWKVMKHRRLATNITPCLQQLLFDRICSDLTNES